MKVLVVCSGNICRSPMGEVILQNLARAANLDLQVSSAGTLDIDGAEASKNSVLVCRENDLGLENFRSTALSRVPLKDYQQILVMEPKHEVRVRELAEGMNVPIHLLRKFSGEDTSVLNDLFEIPDPIGKDISVYSESFVLIRRCMEGFLKMLQERE